jgi:hypothetical protein
MRPLRRQGPRCRSARWAERRDASTHMLRCSGTSGPAAAARCSSCTTAIAGHGTAAYSGELPCLRAGSCSRFVRSIANALISMRRVSLGSMTSST